MCLWAGPQCSAGSAQSTRLRHFLANNRTKFGPLYGSLSPLHLKASVLDPLDVPDTGVNLRTDGQLSVKAKSKSLMLHRKELEPFSGRVVDTFVLLTPCLARETQAMRNTQKCQDF